MKKKESKIKETGDQERRRRKHTKSPRINAAAPSSGRTQKNPSRRRQRKDSGTQIAPVIYASLVPLGSRSRAPQTTNPNIVFPSDPSPAGPEPRLLTRPTRSTYVEYRTFIGNGRLSEVKSKTIRVNEYDTYESLADYLYELSGGIIASLQDRGGSRSASLHMASVYYTTYQDHLKKPMKRMLCNSDWYFFQESAYRMEIRWLPFRPHLFHFLDFERQLPQE